jgi:amino acid transporter
VSEETHDPGRRAPIGIVSSVAVSAVAGFALVAALVLAVRDPAATAAAGDGAALHLLSGALGPLAGRFALGLAVIAMWFAGLSSVTSASRMLCAFARDEGLPLARWLRRVHPATGTPLHATGACVAAPILLVAITIPLDPEVFLAVAALATIGLNASYALPIALGAVARARGRWTRPGPWSLGRAGVPVAWAAVGWTLFVFLVCTLANAAAMATFAVILGLLAALWGLVVRKEFRGPRVDLAHFEPKD